MRRALVVVIVLVLIAIGAAAWLRRPIQLFIPLTRADSTVVSVMKSDLTGVRNAEFDYYRMKGRFTEVADSTIFLRTPGSGEPLIKLDGKGWYASVRHPLLPGVICAIAIGTSNPLQRSAKEGEPVCR